MSKNLKKTATTIAPEDYIYAIKAEPTFPGRAIMKHSVVREQIWSVTLGPNKDATRRVINEEYTIPASGTMTAVEGQPILNEDMAIDAWGQKTASSIKQAKSDIKEAEEVLRQKKQELDLLENISKTIDAYSEKGTLDFDKEGELKHITVISK